MAGEQTIIDAHAHVFSRVRGRNRSGPVRGGRDGMIITGKGPRPFLPPYWAETRFSVDVLLRLMDREGVGRAVLLQNPTIGTVNGEIAEALEAHPKRLCGTIQVDPVDSTAIATIEHYAANPAQRVLKFEMSEEWGWTGIHRGLQVDGPEFVPVWETASDLGMVAIIDTGPVGNAGYQVEALENVAANFPDVRFLIEHLGYLTPDVAEDAGALARRRRLLDLATRDNVFLGFSACASLLEEDFPCSRALQLLKEAVNIVGADKILWGTDVPLTLCRYTYGQMIRVVSERAGFLTEKDRNLILGTNSARLFPWKEANAG